MIWEIAMGVVLGGIILAFLPMILAGVMSALFLLMAGVRIVWDEINKKLFNGRLSQPSSKGGHFLLWLWWILAKSAKGRITRLDYILTSFSIVAILVFPFLVVVFLEEVVDWPFLTDCAALITIIICVVGLYRIVTLQIQRFHDLDISGWWILLFFTLKFVPILGIIVSIVWWLSLWFAPGTKGSNKYGPDPLAAKRAKKAEAEPELIEAKPVPKKKVPAKKPAAKKAAPNKPAAKKTPAKTPATKKATAVKPKPVAKKPAAKAPAKKKTTTKAKPKTKA